jgi:methylated-DNA-[protein]-cysteine S-methyltransferase
MNASFSTREALAFGFAFRLPFAFLLLVRVGTFRSRPPRELYQPMVLPPFGLLSHLHNTIFSIFCYYISMTFYTYKQTPAGTVLLLGDGKVVTGVHWKSFKRAPKVKPEWKENKKVFVKLSKELDEYFKGKRKSFNTKFMAQGTPFQMKVWRELRKIRFGAISSYKDIAKAIGSPKAVRAVGTAIGSNPMCIIVPCHRVLTSGNKLGGYSGGLGSKKALLEREKITWK